MDSSGAILNDIVTSHNRHFDGDIENKIATWSDEQNMCLLYSNGRIASCGFDSNWWEKTTDEQSEIMPPFCQMDFRLPFRHYGGKLTFAVLTYEECLAYRARMQKLVD